MSAAMVKNPAEAATVMPNNVPGDTGPAALPLTTNMTASSLTAGGNSCLDEQIERLKRCEYLREGEVKALCLRAREILVDESNVQRVDAPVTVRKNEVNCASLKPLLLKLLSLFNLSHRYAETFMDSFMTWWNFSKWEENAPTRIISFWETLSIGDITVLKPSCCFWHSRSGTPIGSP
jgi:hypothetical protein